MSIYNINDVSLQSAYDVDGESISTAYDVNGNEVFSDSSEPFLFKVMTYNVRWFTGINSQQTMQEAIIDTYDTDIIGMQEVTKNGTVPTVGQNVLVDYPTIQLSNHSNYIAMASKTSLSNIVIADFVNQDPEDMTQYNETRAYMMADISVNGKTIKWINTHLAPNTASYKYLQMQEILNLAKNHRYVIITGDFNSYNYTSPSDSEYADMYGIFANEGFKMANHQPNSYTKTWTNNTSATSLADFTSPTDDIIVSPSIDIVDVVFDTTKLSYLMSGQEIDHIPIIATLEIS